MIRPKYSATSRAHQLHQASSSLLQSYFQWTPPKDKDNWPQQLGHSLMPWTSSWRSAQLQGLCWRNAREHS